MKTHIATLNADLPFPDQIFIQNLRFMKLTLIQDLELLRGQAQQWNAVAGEHPFLQFDWLVGWLAEQVDTVSPAVLVALDGEDNWCGIAPFCVESKSLVRKLRLLGSGSTCSDYLGMMALPNREQVFTKMVVQWLQANIRSPGPIGRIDVVELEGIDRGDANIQFLDSQLTAAGFQSHHVSLEGCWALDLPECWDMLNRNFSKSLRRKTKKALQRLSAANLIVCDAANNRFDQLWTLFVDLHQQRRQMLGQAGCFVDEKFTRFLREATQRLIQLGRAELVVINHQDLPIATYLQLNDGHTAYLYQSGMDANQVALEPGYQIVVTALRRAIEQGYRRFDFLRGDEPYKSRWLTTRIPLTRSRYIPPQFGARLKHELWKTGFTIKQALKSKVAVAADND